MEQSAYYIFNVNQNDGFVIISADDCAKPVIAYSFEGSYDLSNRPPSLDFFLKTRENEILNAIKNQVKSNEEIDISWSELAEIDINNLRGVKTIVPLILTEWGQSGYYNDACPESGGEQAVVGCVALAMGMVLKYYNHPAQGQSSHSYSYPSGWPTYWPYGTLSANFGATTYKWQNMPLNCTQENSDVATLLYHCGVAVDMYYASDGSGSQTYMVMDALEDYFKYSASHAERTSYSELNWSNLLKNEIDNERPIVYSGSDDTGGHAWNCDGYQGSEFHMNWGWNGAYNGYYSLDNLTAGGYSFYQSFEITYQIIPLSGYPTYCTGTKTITGTEGSFNDGSGNMNYQNNIDCYYLIQPTCGDVVEVSWDVFQIESNDVINVYDGSTTSAPLLASFTGDSIPTDVSTGNGTLLIEFSTDGTGNDIGWYASYQTEFCSTTKVLTASSGSFTDGSGTCEYESGTYCKWDITPPSATSVTVSFSQFNLSPNDTYDYVKIYKDNTNTANLVYSFTSANPPSGSYFIPSGHAIVRFVTNSLEQSLGWTLSYTSLTTDVEELNTDIYKFDVYPNPFSNDASIQYSVFNNSDISIRLTNSLGEILSEVKEFNNSGTHELLLSDIYKNIDNGIYFITIISEKKSITKRIVCTK
jgi:hypothetical protein